MDGGGGTVERGGGNNFDKWQADIHTYTCVLGKSCHKTKDTSALDYEPLEEAVED